MEKSEFTPEKNESIEKIKPEGIIAGSPGIGKTTLVENCPNDLHVLDFDSNPYRSDPNWPTNYLSLIEEKFAETDLLLISSYPEVVKELTDRGYEVTIICADESLEDEYRERYISRGNEPEMVERFITSAFASNEEQSDRFPNSKIIFLKRGQYLADIIDFS